MEFVKLDFLDYLTFVVSMLDYEADKAWERCQKQFGKVHHTLIMVCKLRPVVCVVTNAEDTDAACKCCGNGWPYGCAEVVSSASDGLD